MSWQNIKSEIYTMLDSIAIVDGYNYDWDTEKRYDTYIPDNDNVTATVHYPTDAPFEVDVSEEENAVSNERILRRDIEIKCRVVSDATVVDEDDIVDENNDALDKALEDLLAKFGGNYLLTCGNGVYKVDYIQASKEDITSKGVYYPFLLNVEFSIFYRVQRG